MKNDQLDRLKRMAIGNGQWVAHCGAADEHAFLAFDDASIARLAMAITDECAKICSEMADADLSAGDCETAIRNLYMEKA